MLPLVALLTASPLLLGAAPVSGVALDAEQARRSFSEGLEALEHGDPATAADCFATATAIVPSWGLAHLELGIAHSTLDPADPRVAAELESAVALEPENPRARMHLGLAYQRLGRLTDAARELRAALARRADLIEARYALAGVLADQGDDAGAIAEFLAVLDRTPNQVGCLAPLAALYERAGQAPLAEAALIAITRLVPAVPYHRYRLAEFYDRTGAREKARHVYSELEALDPRQRKMRKLR
jgi:tetratricopeptide (TPR) repeat protein